MRKYINVRMDGSDINIDVLKSSDDLSIGYGACGWLDEADLDDLNTPARLMARQLTGSEDESVVEQLEEAFEEILTRRPIGVNVNWA
jgi:hypothetical protein